MLMLVLFLQEGHIQQGTSRSPCHQHSSEPVTKTSRDVTHCLYTEKCPDCRCPTNLTPLTLDLVLPYTLNMRQCACYSLLSLTSLTSISATAWQLAQRNSHPQAALQLFLFSNTSVSTWTQVVSPESPLPSMWTRSRDPGDNTSLSRQEYSS